MTDAQIAQFQGMVSKGSDSVGQARMQALHGGPRDKLEIAPKLQAGIGLVRTGAGTARVGDRDTLAQRLQEYADIGIDTVIGSGYPHREAAYWVAALLFPKLKLPHRGVSMLPPLRPMAAPVGGSGAPDVVPAGRFA